MKIAQDPLIIALIAAAVTAAVYKFTDWARFAGMLAAVAVFFAAATFPGLMKTAHHPVSSGWGLVVIITGTGLALLAFFLLVLRGHHEKPLFKRKGAAGGASGNGQPGGKSKKAPHHRAMAATVAAMVFTALLIFNVHDAAHAGGHGFSQSWSELTG